MINAKSITLSRGEKPRSVTFTEMTSGFYYPSSHEFKLDGQVDEFARGGRGQVEGLPELRQAWKAIQGAMAVLNAGGEASVKLGGALWPGEKARGKYVFEGHRQTLSVGRGQVTLTTDYNGHSAHVIKASGPRFRLDSESLQDINNPPKWCIERYGIEKD